MPGRRHLVIPRTGLPLVMERMCTPRILLLAGLERRFARPRALSLPVRRRRGRRVACLATARRAWARTMRRGRRTSWRGHRRSVHAVRVHVVRSLLDRVAGVLNGSCKGRRGCLLLMHGRLVCVGSGSRVACGGRRSLVNRRLVRVLLPGLPDDEDDAEDKDRDHRHAAYRSAYDGADGCR